MAIFPGLGRFKEFWCQKVLPLVYDDSLSFYEVLCRMRAKLNEVIDNLNKQGEYIETQLPILVDQTVRKYFNANQNLPFIDCFAHGITDSLSDVGPALQNLINTYGINYGYYMRGLLRYNLNSTLTLPQHITFICDGTFECTFNGKIVINSFSNITIKGINGNTDLVKPIKTTGICNDTNLTLLYAQGCADPFDDVTMINCNIDINTNTGVQFMRYVSEVKASTIKLNAVHNTTSITPELFNAAISNCNIFVTNSGLANITLGDKIHFTCATPVNNITAGSDCQITIPSNQTNSAITINPFTTINGHVYYGGSSDMAGVTALYGNKFFGHAIQDHHYSTTTGQFIPAWGVSQISLSTSNFSTTLGDNFLLTGFHGIVHAVANITNCQVLVPRFGDTPVTMVATQGTTLIGSVGLILEVDHYYFINCVPNAHRVFAYDLTSGTIAKDFGPPNQTRSLLDDGTLNYSYNRWERDLYANTQPNPESTVGATD